MPIDARIPLQGIPFQPPRFDLGDTYAQVARIQALEEQRRGQALLNRGNERALTREDAWQAAMAQVFTPPPAAAQGLSGTPQPPAQGLTAPPMAAQTLPASPAQGQYGLMAPPRPQGMPSSLTQAPAALQAPMMLGPQPAQGLTAPPAGLPGAPSPPDGLTAPAPRRTPNPLAQLVQPLNLEALQQAYLLDPERTGQAHARHVQMQGQQLAQAKQLTTRLYTGFKRMLGSDNPQRAYEVGVQQLRREGVPLPDDLPPTVDPAWLAFTVDSLRTTETDLAELNVEQERAKLRLDQFKAATERVKAEGEAQKPQVDQDRLELDREKLRLDERKFQREQTKAGSEVEYLDTPQGRIAVPKYPDAGGAAVGARPVTVDGQPAMGAAGHAALEQTRSAELKAQTHYDQLALPYRQVRDAMGRITATEGENTPAGGLSLLYAYMKMLDPDTGIRNEEVRNAESLGGLPGQAYRWIAHLKGDNPLPPKVQQDFLASAKKLYTQYRKDYEDVAEQYRALVTRQGLNPDNVVLDFRSTTPAGGRAGAPPTTGTRPVGEMSREELRAEREALRGKR